jgi:signal peptidase II
MNRLWRVYANLIRPAGVILLIDQLCKWLVRSNLALEETWMPFEWLADYARIVHWQNTGASFGFLEDQPSLFILLALVALAAIVYYFPRIPTNDWSMRWSLALLAGGVASNLLDRLLVGYVVDYISVGPLYVFNLADLSNLAGVLVLLAGVLIEEWHKLMGKGQKTSLG